MAVQVECVKYKAAVCFYNHLFAVSVLNFDKVAMGPSLPGVPHKDMRLRTPGTWPLAAAGVVESLRNRVPRTGKLTPPAPHPKTEPYLEIAIFGLWRAPALYIAPALGRALGPDWPRLMGKRESYKVRFGFPAAPPGEYRTMMTPTKCLNMFWCQYETVP